ncbi:MAG TPA: Stp1/IreP family PP2C-type Ser/Thr phosphatase [Clostridiaceae bacterium]|jgi:protein phosphatase|nr:Stp1/IreP family PP2C-type Ser/Thr phosphatase [Clostridiaceae bacterium]
MRYASATDKGKVRQNNEDFHAILSVGDSTVFVVADGMGGHAVGEIASRTAVEFALSTLPRELEHDMSVSQIEDVLRETIEKANVRVYLQSLDNKEYRGMGTTLTLAVLKDWRLYISHIGDCRVYLMHGSGLERLTVDHTLVQELVDRGSISEKEAQNHPKRHVLVRSLGVNEYMEPDTYSFDISEGDLILLCTDGLYGYVDEAGIRKIIRKHKDLSACAKQLVDAANDAGGGDNITVILVDCTPDETKETI